MKKTALILLLLAALLLCVPASGEEGKNEVTLELKGGTLSVAADAEYVDLGTLSVPDTDAGYDALEVFLFSLPNLKKVDMFATDIPRTRVNQLAQMFPDVEFGWTMVIPCSNRLHPERNPHRIRTDATAFSTLHNKYCSAHTNEDFEMLKYCKNLLALDLGHNHITDLSFLCDLPNLRVLILARNAVADLTPIASLKDLEYLEIFSNELTDLSALVSCEKLVDLNIGYNHISDLTPLCEMTSLRRLWVYNIYKDRGRIPKEDEAMLKAALPECKINTTNAPTEGGWRKHSRYNTIAAMFNPKGCSYIPFDTLE